MEVKQLLKHKGALAGIIILLLVLLSMTLGSYMLDYSPTQPDFLNMMSPPSWTHLFGTDSMGRDVLARVLDGAVTSFGIGTAGVVSAAVVGTSVGLYIGYQHGFMAQTLTRLSDFIFSFPSFVLAIFLMVAMGFGARNTVVAIALIYFPIFVRLARNLTLTVKQQGYIYAAQINGQSRTSIMFQEILPNILSPLLVQLTLGIAFGIVIEAGLSFLGLGVQPPAPSLGSIMADGREYFQRAPWVLTLAGLFISFALLGLNLLSDGLRDLTDPRLKQ